MTWSRCRALSRFAGLLTCLGVSRLSISLTTQVLLAAILSMGPLFVLQDAAFHLVMGSIVSPSPTKKRR